MKQTTDLRHEAEKEIREYSDDKIIWTKEPFSERNTFVVRGKYCDFEEKTNGVIAYLKETSISNDSLEWRVRDNEIIDNKSKIAWCKDVPTANHILEAVNNYNALKEVNAELYNALAAIMHSSGIDDFNSIKPNHSKLTQRAIAALQKAKQL